VNGDDDDDGDWHGWDYAAAAVVVLLFVGFLTWIIVK
jgi:hypothetical protein